MEVFMNTITKIVMMALVGLSVVAQADLSAAAKIQYFTKNAAGNVIARKRVAAPVAPVRQNLEFDDAQVAREEALRQADERAEYEDACAEYFADKILPDEDIFDTILREAALDKKIAEEEAKIAALKRCSMRKLWKRVPSLRGALAHGRDAVAARWNSLPTFRGAVSAIRNNPGRSALVATSVASAAVAAPVLAGVALGTQASVTLGLTATAVSGVSGYAATKYEATKKANNNI